ncbi:VOC family protein [Jejuia pallidilutea]|uniref:Glyoxalase/dioxygenase superfamily protein n=1 Tax=Jejuia pallidilutea TaxID=504487 RepID=A0A090X012_9FLAO|nr:VOC family protein [Jejuia pallidilutea]GAL67808.1 glyoxalase/dioxygenase superfamily protein [Jejuia pallidilutea]GAL72942.1 glyoxalase/dioxygenase superfamily protein [Jejuia pallidilutea]GAL89990.1 glyoxalase/dioxygenase superfamily protein [Jejuia pallidilutea]
MDLNQITVPSLDVEKAIGFYKTLGLKLIVKALPHYARFECSKGNSTFSIHLVAQLPKGNGISIYFEDDNLDDLVAKLQKKGVAFISLPQDKPWLWREAHLRDLDGNLIILYKAGENRKNPPWRIN